MPDQDLFEARFAAAYRRYLEEAPAEVDAAAVARAVATRARGARTWTWPGSLRLEPALAWLALLALLLAALGAALVIGSHRTALGFACPAGTDPDTPGHIAQARPPFSYAGPPMAFDRKAGRIVAVVTDLGAILSETWSFDVCTNTWSRMRPDREPASVGRLVYDVDSGLTVAMGGRTAWAYDLEANTWTEKGPVPGSLQSQPRLVYDSATGLVVAQSAVSAPTDPWELWSYDVDSDTWTPIQQTGGPEVPPDHARQVLAYDPSVDRLVSYDAGSEATWLFDLRKGVWSKSGAVTPSVMFGWGNSGGEIAYDESTRRAIVFSYGRVIAYDAAADRWDVLVAGWDPDQHGGSGGPTYLSMPSMAYDPVNQRLLVHGGQYMTSELDDTIWLQSDQVLAFDAGTREWTTLLEAKAVKPPPS